MSSYTSYKFHCRDWDLVEDNSYMERHTSPNMAPWRITPMAGCTVRKMTRKDGIVS